MRSTSPFVDFSWNFLTCWNNPLEDSHANNINYQQSSLGLVLDVIYVQKLGFLG
jgi:hypothetical protein